MIETIFLCLLCLFVGAGFSFSIAAFFFSWKAYTDRRYTPNEVQALVNDSFGKGVTSGATGLAHPPPSVALDPDRERDWTPVPPIAEQDLNQHPFDDGAEVDPAEAYEIAARQQREKMNADGK